MDQDKFREQLQQQAHEEMKVFGAKLSQLTVPVLRVASNMVTELLLHRIIEQLLRDGLATEENLQTLFTQLDAARASDRQAVVIK